MGSRKKQLRSDAALSRKLKKAGHDPLVAVRRLNQPEHIARHQLGEMYDTAKALSTAPAVLATNPDEIELGDGGAMEWDDDGTIRYRDRHGNSEGVWRPGEPEYDGYKNDYFPNHTVKSEDDDAENAS